MGGHLRVDADAEGVDEVFVPGASHVEAGDRRERQAAQRPAGRRP